MALGSRQFTPNILIPNSVENNNTPFDLSKVLRVNVNNTFENFKITPANELVYKAIRAVVDGKKPMAMIFGGVGNGKTHLLHAAAIELYKTNRFARVYEYKKILSVLKSAMNNAELNYEDILNNYCYGERLIIDDVGAGGTDTKYADDILEAIICTRYARELMTIMSTNRPIESLPERVVSRLKDKAVCYLVLNKAPDYRPTK
jgi:DNA replication protein DnaC